MEMVFHRQLGRDVFSLGHNCELNYGSGSNWDTAE